MDDKSKRQAAGDSAASMSCLFNPIRTRLGEALEKPIKSINHVR
jgi:hypothetical protein